MRIAHWSAKLSSSAVEATVNTTPTPLGSVSRVGLCFVSGLCCSFMCCKGRSVYIPAGPTYCPLGGGDSRCHFVLEKRPLSHAVRVHKYPSIVTASLLCHSLGCPGHARVPRRSRLWLYRRSQLTQQDCSLPKEFP